MVRKILLFSLLTLVLAACGGNPDVPDGPGDDTPLPIELTATNIPASLFEGTWFNDAQSMDIFILPEGDFLFFYADENSNECGGDVFRATGAVEIAGVNTILLTGTSTCDSNDEEGQFSLEMTYDPDENVLLDPSGNKWTRS